MRKGLIDQLSEEFAFVLFFFLPIYVIFSIVPFLIILVNDIYATIAYSVVPDNTNFLKYNG